MTAPTPIAEGSLARTPLAHVLLTVLERRLTGTLAIWPDPDEDLQGQDRVLVRAGRLVRGRFITPAGDLARGLLPAMRRTAAPYAFYEEDLVGDDDSTIAGSLHPLALIAAAVRGGARKDVIAGVLAKLGSRPYRLKKGADLTSFDLVRKEHAVIDLLQASPAPLEELVRLSGDERSARRVLYLLAITKNLVVAPGRTSIIPGSIPPNTGVDADDRFSGLPRLETEPPPHRSVPAPPPRTSKPPARKRRPGGNTNLSSPGVPEPAPPVPDGLSADLADKWRDVASRADNADEQNYFEMLGVESNATDEEIREAFVKTAKAYHPDRLPPDLAPLRPWADAFFRHVTEAEKTLTDSDKRAAYFKNVQDGGGTPAADRELTVILGAALEFQKVEVLVRRRDWPEAMEILDQILEVAPDEPDYAAMRAWLLLQTLGDAAHKEIKPLAEKALAARPTHERALLTLAHLAKRQGDADASRDYFERVVQANGKNLDAVRELRLANMRMSKSPKGKSKPDGEGLFGKLFGKKK